MRRLMLLRHAQTEDARPGFPDLARRLTPDGERQAVALGDHLRRRPARLDLVLCSSATRAQQTAEALRITAPLVVDPRLYNAGGDQLLALIRQLGDEVEHVLLVGHAPGLPAVVHQLADPQTSDPDALGTIEWRFPAGALATLDVEGAWSAVDRATLVAVRLP